MIYDKSSALSKLDLELEFLKNQIIIKMIKRYVMRVIYIRKKTYIGHIDKVHFQNGLDELKYSLSKENWMGNQYMVEGI